MPLVDAKKLTTQEAYTAHKVSLLASQRSSLLATIERLQSAQVELDESRELLAMVEQDLRGMGWKPEDELAAEREAKRLETNTENQQARDAAVARSVEERKASEAEVEGARQRALAEQQRRAAAQQGPDLQARANHTAA